MKSEKRQIENEIQNLIKLAEAESKQKDGDVQALIELGEDEIHKIKTQCRRIIS